MKRCLTLPAIRDLESDGFFVTTQPIFTRDTKGALQLSGYELSPRLHSGDQTLRFRKDFEEVMNDHQLQTLDALIIREAIRAAADSAYDELLLSFTLRASNLASVEFAHYLISRISVLTGEQRSRLMVEVPGDQLPDEKSSLQHLHRLKETLNKLTKTGVRVCIGGVNHRNNGFRLVSQIPVNAIKLCREAIKAEIRFRESGGDETESMDLDILRSFGLSMRAWNCIVIADGIEAMRETAVADDIGATHYQGEAWNTWARF